MVNLKTTYMGLELPSPLVVSANPLSEHLDNIKRMEDSGAGAVVLFSLFAEQIRRERELMMYYTTHGADSFAEALTFFPEPPNYHAGPDQYLELIRKAREATAIPIIASLNGTSPDRWSKLAQLVDQLEGWTTFARRMEQAGASAIELNIYYIPTDAGLTGMEVELTYLRILQAVRQIVNVPVAVKLSPYFSNLANFAKHLDSNGADALVLFNRFYQPDIDLDTLEVTPNVILSISAELRLPLRWIAILHGQIEAHLAATSGIHSGHDALKVLLAGAQVAMMASALLRNGIDYLRTVEAEMRTWMEEREYESVDQLRGSVSQKNYGSPSEFERAQYMKALTSYKPLW